MRFVDLLKSTVMLSAGAATMLAIVTVIGATSDHDDTLVLIATGWWVAASLIGVHSNHSIRRRADQARKPVSLPR